MSSDNKILVSEADPRRRGQIIAALAELGTARGISGGTQDVMTALSGGGYDAIVLGGPADSFLARIEAIRSDQPSQIPVAIFSAGIKAGDPLVGPAILRHSASFVSVTEEAFKDKEIDANAARSLRTRLMVLLRSAGQATKRSAPVARPAKSGQATPTLSRSNQPAGSPAKSPGRSSYELVVVASSTGGPNALSDLFGALPGTIRQPIVIVQHMPAGFVKGLATRLDRACELTVKVAEDGEVLAESTVYVAPGGTHLKVIREQGFLVAKLEQGPPVHSCCPAADVLFESAVKASGGAVVAVVLTGMGNDGAAGAKMIRDRGGFVLAQDEASSTVWGMPGATVELGAAQEILAPEAIAASLTVRLGGASKVLTRKSSQPNLPGTTRGAETRGIGVAGQGPKSGTPKPGPVLSKPTVGNARAESTSQELAPREFEYVRDLVRDQAAIVLEAGKEYLVQVRLEPLVRKRGYGSVSELISDMMKAKGGPLAEAVVEALTTNETTFFRDGSPFKILRETLIPELVARAGKSKKVRIWCAASSTGQEPYSIAMCLQEAIANAASWDIKIRASDISDEVLEKAKAGTYNQLEVSRGLPAPMMIKHFTKQGLSWEIKDHIKRMVSFEKINLIKKWPNFEPLDFLFIRNVLIYFDVKTKQSILANARALLKPEGVLFLGSAETTLGLVEGFDKQDLRGGGAFRRCA